MDKAKEFLIAALPFLLLFSASLAFAEEKCVGDYCVGTPVITIGDAPRTGIIENIAEGSLAVRFKDNGGLGTASPDDLAIAKPGYCIENACVGPELYFHLERRLRIVSIAGVYKKENKTQIVLLYHSNEWTNPYGASWTMEALATSREDACGDSLCVGDRVYNIERKSKKALVAGVYKSGDEFRYVIRYDDIDGLSVDAKDPMPHYGEAWTRKDLEVFERGQGWRNREETNRLEKEGGLDRAQYEALRRQGKTHEEALLEASGPIWSSIDRTENFLDRLSRHLYQFDRAYVLQVKALLAPGANLERRRLFVTAAILPYIRNLGYRSLHDPYLDRSIANMESSLQREHITQFQDIEATSLMRRMAIHMLAASLQTSLPQMRGVQKETASELLKLLGDLASGKLRWRDMEPLFSVLPRYRALLLDLSLNSYLRARVQTDMQLLDYLENS